MKPTNDGGPAFPEFMGDHMEPKRGMTLRDYFAAAAMAALIAKIPLHDRLGKIGVHAPAIEDIHRRLHEERPASG